MSGDDVRVLVVDDQRLIRDGIASVLSVQDGIEVAGVAANGRQAVDESLRLLPDVVLMDIRMPVLDGVAATALLLAALPAARVLMLTTFDDEEYVLAALRAGACGYLLKDRPAQELAQAVRLAAAGVDQYDPAATRRLADAARRLPDRTSGTSGTPHPVDATTVAAGTARGAASSPVPLTPREEQVLLLIADGASNREIARRLYLSEGTVKNHVSSILARLGLRDRTQAALYARDHGRSGPA